MLENYNLSGTKMDLPMLLAYADDIIIISENTTELVRFLAEFIHTDRQLEHRKS